VRHYTILYYIILYYTILYSLFKQKSTHDTKRNPINQSINDMNENTTMNYDAVMLYSPRLDPMPASLPYSCCIWHLYYSCFFILSLIILSWRILTRRILTRWILTRWILTAIWHTGLTRLIILRSCRSRCIHLSRYSSTHNNTWLL